MPHLTLFERIRIVKLFNDLLYGIREKYERISKQAKDRYSIQISESGIRRLINKQHNTETLADRPGENKSKCLISKAGILAINNALLKNSFLTVKKIKVQLVLTASTRTISRYINMLGLRKVNTKYCQMELSQSGKKIYILLHVETS